LGNRESFAFAAKADHIEFRRNWWDDLSQKLEQHHEISDCYVGECGLSRSGLLGALCLGNQPTMLFAKPEIMILVRLTCPIALLSHYPISLSWVLLANAATYALVGLILKALCAFDNP
jgi:hypothetical protein